MLSAKQSTQDNESARWYSGITAYQWLVLAIASAGWVFDVYEGQIFNVTRGDMLREILGSSSTEIKRYGDIFLAIFLLGGTIGGLAAGTLADRFGRKPVLIATILMYSIFSGLTFFATTVWHVALLRFFVALGVGGEWAVAASLVSEVFPARARAQASGIFHASSVLGTWMAAIVGMAVAANWRLAYLFGIAPALLIVWVRSRVNEPTKWQTVALEAANDASAITKMGSFRELLGQSPWNKHALLGVALAAVGLGTFWAVTVAGQDLAHQMLLQNGATDEAAAHRAKFAYGIIQTAGGGIGLLAFGPLSARFGRRLTFAVYQLLAFCIVPITCFVPQTYTQLLLLLPVFGFLTLGIHAGYAIYFPELFPTRLRATGASFCFNGGRVAAVPVLLLSGWLKGMPDIDFKTSITVLAGLFLLGAGLMAFLPETNRTELPQ